MGTEIRRFIGSQAKNLETKGVDYGYPKMDDTRYAVFLPFWRIGYPGGPATRTLGFILPSTVPSKSCPPLKSEPYRGDDLNRQLTDVTEAFLNDPDRNRLNGNTLYVSKIFKWYKEDFNNDVVGFFMKYARGTLRDDLRNNRKEIEVEYLDDDWSLNGRYR